MPFSPPKRAPGAPGRTRAPPKVSAQYTQTKKSQVRKDFPPPLKFKKKICLPRHERGAPRRTSALPWPAAPPEAPLALRRGRVRSPMCTHPHSITHSLTHTHTHTHTHTPLMYERSIYLSIYLSVRLLSVYLSMCVLCVFVGACVYTRVCGCGCVYTQHRQTSVCVCLCVFARPRCANR